MDGVVEITVHCDIVTFAQNYLDHTLVGGQSSELLRCCGITVLHHCTASRIAFCKDGWTEGWMHTHAGKMTSALNSAKMTALPPLFVFCKRSRKPHDLLSRLVVDGFSAGNGLSCCVPYSSYAIVVFRHRRHEASNLRSQSRRSFSTKVHHL
jgi:hypothetical protein